MTTGFKKGKKFIPTDNRRSSVVHSSDISKSKIKSKNKSGIQPKIYWADAKGQIIIDKGSHYETKDGKLIYWDGNDHMRGVVNVLGQRAISKKPL